MSRFTDHSYVDAKWDSRPEIARILIAAAKELGADHQDPMVLASTSEGFRVRNDVLAASGLDQPEPAPSPDSGAASAASAENAEKAAPGPAPEPAQTAKAGGGGRPGKSNSRKE